MHACMHAWLNSCSEIYKEKYRGQGDGHSDVFWLLCEPAFYEYRLRYAHAWKLVTFWSWPYIYIHT